MEICQKIKKNKHLLKNFLENNSTIEKLNLTLELEDKEEQTYIQCLQNFIKTAPFTYLSIHIRNAYNSISINPILKDIKNKDTLQVLKLSRLTYNPEEFETLAETMSSLPHLHTLKLKDIGLESKTISPLLESLVTLQELESLDFSNNFNLEFEGLKAILEQLPRFPLLKSLNLYGIFETTTGGYHATDSDFKQALEYITAGHSTSTPFESS